MTFKEYIPLAMRTNAEIAITEEDHVTLGITTELGEIVDIFKKHLVYGAELDIAHLKEEIGDMAWYLALGLNYGRFFPYGYIEECNYVYIVNNTSNWREYNSAVVLDFSKDVVEMCYPYTNEHGIVYALKKLCNTYSIDFNECLDLNIKKLQKRYPDKFSSDKALNRDLKAEDNILGKA